MAIHDHADTRQAVGVSALERSFELLDFEQVADKAAERAVERLAAIEPARIKIKGAEVAPVLNRGSETRAATLVKPARIKIGGAEVARAAEVVRPADTRAALAEALAEAVADAITEVECDLGASIEDNEDVRLNVLMAITEPVVRVLRERLPPLPGRPKQATPEETGRARVKTR